MRLPLKYHFKSIAKIIWPRKAKAIQWTLIRMCSAAKLQVAELELKDTTFIMCKSVNYKHPEMGLDIYHRWGSANLVEKESI